MIFNLPEGIPNQVFDTKELMSFYSRYQVIPQFGTTDKSSATFLSLLRSLTDLSPTFTAAMRDLKAYTFGLNIEITQSVIPGLKMEIQPVAEADQVAFATWLAGVGISLQRITALSKRLKHHLAVSGNAYLKIKRVRVGAAVKYKMDVPFYTHCAYLVSQDPGENFLIVSPYIGDAQKLSERPPLILRATQAAEQIRWLKTGNGVEEAIIHVKADTDEEESPYYARPDIIHCLPALFTDYQLDNLNSKISAAELVSKKLLAFQAPDPNSLDSGDDERVEVGDSGVLGRRRGSPFQAAMLQLKEISTNLASSPGGMGIAPSAAFAGIQYPYGDKPPLAIDLEMNRDTKHQAWQLETCVRRICSILGWAPELVSMISAKATLGGNMLRDILIQKEISTIAPDQFFFADLWNSIIAEIKTDEAAPAAFESYGIRFPRVITELLDLAAPGGGADNSLVTLNDQTAQNQQEDE